MNFKYFDKPELFIGFMNDPTLCTICGQQKPCFDAKGFYGQETIEAICANCLSDGKLYGRDIVTCEGDSKTLKQQIRALNAGLSHSDINAIVIQKTAELEKTTPQLITWQDWSWPCADGDYCRFIGYGSRPFYNKLAPDRNGKKLFKNSLDEPDHDSNELWDDYLPDKEVKNYQDSSAYGTLFYIFKSLHTDIFITRWDSE